MKRFMPLLFPLALFSTDCLAPPPVPPGGLWESSPEDFRDFMREQGLVTDVYYGDRALEELRRTHAKELEKIKRYRDFYTAEGRFIGLHSEGHLSATDYAENLDRVAFVRQHEAVHALRHCTGRKNVYNCVEELETLQEQAASKHSRHWTKGVTSDWDILYKQRQREVAQLKASGALDGPPESRICPRPPPLEVNGWEAPPRGRLRRAFSYIFGRAMRAYDIYGAAADPIGTAVDEVTSRVISNVVPHPAVLLPGAGVMALGGPLYADAAKNVLVDEAFRGSAEYKAAFATLRGEDRNSPLSSRQQQEFFDRVADVIYRYDNNMDLDESDYSFINSVPWEFPEGIVDAAR